jgi:predicted anti-sigma-YlaC factor YlaD
MTATIPMNCEEVLSFLADYLEDGLPAPVLERFEWHLERCVSCRNYLATYGETIRVAMAASSAPMLHVQEPPEDLVEAILKTVMRTEDRG